jgi:hypothetical protein
VETGGLVGSIRCLFVHFFDLFHNLVSLLLEKSDVSGLLLNCLLELLYLLAQTFIFREKYDVLLSNRKNLVLQVIFLVIDHLLYPLFWNIFFLIQLLLPHLIRLQ